MAYAALILFQQTLEKILHPHHPQIQSLMEKVCQLMDFLEYSSENRCLSITDLEGKIRDAAYEGADIIESHFSKSTSSFWDMFCAGILNLILACQRCETINPELKLKIQLQKIKEEFELILESVSKIKDGKVVEPLQPLRKSLTAGPSRISSSKKTSVVGLDEDLIQIKEKLTGSSSNLEIISVVGMGGIGKTTLARNLYHDSLIEYYFDIRAWATVSQDYNCQEILRNLLKSTTHVNSESHQLEENLYKSLKGRRYLIVMDDVWDTKAWDDVKRLFPDDKNGSRIILTTRISEVALYPNTSTSIHNMSLLSLEDSWNLLCEKVFGEESCPFEFEEIGNEIAQNCKGLPLAIVVIGGLLSKGKRTQDYWRYIARNVTSTLTENDDRLMEILSLSYNYLPHHLKACFLYMGVFPEDHEVRVSQLIKLWVAEGFLKPHCSKNLEEVAEEYLKDLVDRNLIMVRKRYHHGGIKICIIHDVLRDLCVKKAREEKFLLVLNRDARNFPKNGYSEYRVSIHSCIFIIWKHDSRARSFLYFTWIDSYKQSLYFARFRLLKVLDALAIRFYEFPIEIVELVNLRYVALTREWEVPATIAKLKKLQTLILKTRRCAPWFRTRNYEPWCVPSEIWEIQELRHLLLEESLFTYPSDSQLEREMKNLYTLSGVDNLICRKEVFQIMPNLKKLKTCYHFDKLTECSSCDFSSFVYLHKLETLKISFLFSEFWRNASMNFVFPPTLKELTLSGCWISWNNMTIAGSLRNLEVLKLRGSGFNGTVWEPNEGEFLKLKYLSLKWIELEEWKANEEHFPSLEHLSLICCLHLLEIPYEFGNIPNLQMIEIYECNDSIVRSAILIEEEQQNLENDLFKLKFGRVQLKKFYKWNNTEATEGNGTEVFYIY